MAQGEQAVSMGGIFAVSTVLPGKVQHLAFHLKTTNNFGTDGVLDHGLQILGCLMLLSVLIWASKSELLIALGIPSIPAGKHGTAAYDVDPKN